MSYLVPIKAALIIFPFLALLITLPYIIYEYHHYGSVNKLRTLIIYSFILYLMTIYFLVILPLPTKEEVIKMTKTLPSIYGYSIENMKQKIIDIMDLGYTKEEVIKMTKTLPSIYGLSIENIKQKIDFYNLIGMHELTVIDAKLLMQSTNLSYARYSFYMDIGINIDMNNYRKLFINQKQFEKTYGITKEELLERYDYNKYKEEVEKKRG